MKVLFIVVAVLLVNSEVRGQTTSDVDRVLQKNFMRTDSAVNLDRFSLLSLWADISRDAFVYLRKTLPKVKGSLDHNYTQLPSVVYNATSTDHRFRIWTFAESEGSSGTFETLAEFKTPTGTALLDLSDRRSKSAINGGWCDTIYSVTSSEGITYYLPIVHYAADSRTASTSVEVFSIGDGHLKKDIKLFRTPKRELSRISYNYDFFKSEGLSEIRLVDKDLLIPLVEGDSVTSGNLQYEFDGKQFVYKGIEK